MAASTVQTTPTVPPLGSGLAQNSLFGANAVFSSAVMFVKNVVPDRKTIKQEFGELVTGIRSGDVETGVRAVLKYARGQTANVAAMGVFARLAYKKGGMTALGQFGGIAGGGLIGGFAGNYAGTWGGDWFAKNVLHWNKVDIDSDKPVCKGDVICHQRKNLGLWGIALGAFAGAAILFFGAMTFGFGLLAGFVAGAIIGAAHAMSQYGEVKGEIREGSPDVTFERRPVARMGDKVKCDDHSHEEFIAEGVKTVTVNGRLLAKVGCRTTCDGNLDRLAGKAETTIGVDKETATDPENYPIRESTSLLAEIAATAAIYAPWEKFFGKVKGSNNLPRPAKSRLEELRNKYGRLTPEEINQRINLRGKTREALDNFKAEVDTQFSSKKQRDRMLGPAYAGVYDKTTGEYTFAHNHPAGKRPEKIAPQLQSYFDSITPEIEASYTYTRGSGSHAEIYAVNEALLKNPNAKPEDLMVNVIRTGVDLKKPAGMMFPYCPHCGHILQSYHPISGVHK